MIHKTFKGQRLPALGFGTWHLRGDHAVRTVRYALDVGYRHIDTATRYENEAEVGKALRESGIDRAEIFVATKIRWDQLDPDQIEARTRESLARLGLDHVDLLMPHWPSRSHSNDAVMRAFDRVRSLGLTRHIGLSNFTTPLIREAVAATGDSVLANQVEYHPYLCQRRVLEVLRAHGMALTAAVPLARGLINEDPVIGAIAEEHGKSPSQVTLRWLIQQDNVIAIPKSGREDRVLANFQIFDFVLSDAQMAAIDARLGDRRLVNLEIAPEWDPAR